MYNQNFSNFRHNFTFHPNVPPPNFIPPPPFPPPFYIPPTTVKPIAVPKLQNDQEFIKSFEKNVSPTTTKRKPSISISEAREKLRNIFIVLEEVKSQEKYLSENINTMSDVEWKETMEYIENKKAYILKESLPSINKMHLDLLKKLLTKRSAKRSRLKRLNLEKKREKDEMIKKSEERSRKIDENLQKIKDDINKIKQEEEEKLQADMVLKEVLRKKGDAKKCLVKLDALLKLRKAKQNTARGRGEAVSEVDATVFIDNIEKLKAVWSQRLTVYDKEESQLRSQLQRQSSAPTLASQRQDQLVNNLDRWKHWLFGAGGLPQVDFGGDVAAFVAVRSQWDKFISNEGSPLPVGWVVPSAKTSLNSA